MDIDKYNQPSKYNETESTESKESKKTDEHDENWSFNSIIHYISENFVGLLLLIVAFLIIYFVDYVNHLNGMILNTQPQIVPTMNTLHTSSKIKSRKIKKR